MLFVEVVAEGSLDLSLDFLVLCSAVWQVIIKMIIKLYSEL